MRVTGQALAGSKITVPMPEGCGFEYLRSRFGPTQRTQYHLRSSCLPEAGGPACRALVVWREITVPVHDSPAAGLAAVQPKVSSDLAASSASFIAFRTRLAGFGFADRAVGLVRGDRMSAPAMATAGLGLRLFGPQDHCADSGFTDH
jgi:hypothetical protein